MVRREKENVRWDETFGRSFQSIGKRTTLALRGKVSSPSIPCAILPVPPPNPLYSRHSSPSPILPAPPPVLVPFPCSRAEQLGRRSSAVERSGRCPAVDTTEGALPAGAAALPAAIVGGARGPGEPTAAGGLATTPLVLVHASVRLEVLADAAPLSSVDVVVGERPLMRVGFVGGAAAGGAVSVGSSPGGGRGSFVCIAAAVFLIYAAASKVACASVGGVTPRC
jgi:hypothetical protein